MSFNCYISLLFVALSFAVSGFETDQATQHKISSHLEDHIDLTFTEFEQQIEQLSIDNSNNNTDVLVALNNFAEQNPTKNPDEFAYLMSYRCYLEMVTDKQENYQQTQSALSTLSSSMVADPATLAAKNFCKAWFHYFNKSTHQYDFFLEQAFNHVLHSQSSVLKYWISTTFALMTLDTGRYSTAIEAAKLALAIATTNQDDYRIATSRAILALAESELGFYDDALHNNQLAIDWYQSVNNQAAILGLYQNRGYIENSRGNTKQAKTIYLDAIEQAKQLDNQLAIHEIYTNLAAIAFTEGELELSNNYAEKTLTYANDTDHKSLAAHAYSIMAVNYVYLNNLPLAKDYLERGNSFFEEYKMISQLADNYESWSEAMANIQNFEDAYKAHLRYKELSDQIFNSERESRMLRLKELYHATQKDQEIQRLAIENENKNIEIENRALEKRIWLLSAVITLLAFIMLLVFYRKLRSSNKILTKDNSKLNQERFVDPLTQGLNRRFFEVAQRERVLNSPKTRFSFFMLDIDHFKKLNDTYGHACGDHVLKIFSQRVRKSVRQQDNFIRMGGEEFLLVIENNSAESDALLLKKLLNLISSEPIDYEQQQLSITVSIGVASNVEIYEEASLEFALELADQALYKAKHAGRDQGVLLDLYDVVLASVINNFDMIKSKTIFGSD